MRADARLTMEITVSSIMLLHAYCIEHFEQFMGWQAQESGCRQQTLLGTISSPPPRQANPEDVSTMSQALTDAARLANDWLDGLTERPVQAKVSLEELRARFSGPLPAAPSAPE